MKNNKKALLIIGIFLILGIIGNALDNKETSAPAVTQAKAGAEGTKRQTDNYYYRFIEYDKISRYAQTYIGRPVEYVGKVTQISEAGFSNAFLRIDINGNSDATVFVDCGKTSLSNILENDWVTVKGMLDGLKTYKALLGNEITIPKINADDIQIHKTIPDGSYPSEKVNITIKETKWTQNYKGEKALLIILSVTNKTNSSQSIYSICNVDLFQNGSSLKSAYLSDDKNYLEESDKLQTGATALVGYAFEAENGNNLNIEIRAGSYGEYVLKTSLTINDQ